MTGIPPPSNNADLISENERLRAALDAATRGSQGVVRSLENVRRSFSNFVNPITRLQDSIMRMDKTNRDALKIGTTTEKLQSSVSKNSNILSRNLVSNQKLTDAIIQNFESGVRVQNGALGDLTQEMIATGQNLGGLTKANSDLVLFTGNNTNALQTVSKVNKDVSDKYGVSNEKLINSVNSLRDTFEKASFFGPQTTASLEALATEIKGRAGGTNVEAAMRSLMGILTPGMSTLAAGQMLGARGARARAGAGEALSMADIEPILRNVDRIYAATAGVDPEARLKAAAAQAQISEEQFIQLKNLSDILKQNYKTNETIKKTNDETYNSIQNINERARNFYDKTAVGMLAILGSVNTNTVRVAENIAMLGGGLGGLPGAGATRGAGKFGKLGRGFGMAAIGAMAFEQPIKSFTKDKTGFDLGNTLNYAGMGATLGSIVPGIGTGIGAVAGGAIGIFEAIMTNTSKSAEADQERLKMEREKANLEKAQRASEEVRRAQFIIGYLRSRGGVKLDEGNLILKELLDEFKKSRRDQNRQSTEKP